VGHPIIRTQNSNNPTYACRETITSSAKQRGIAPKNASEIKRHRNRDRYWRMTPEHRDAYLQRNREYKRKRKSSCTNSDIVQSAVSQATTTHISTGTEGILFCIYVFCLFLSEDINACCMIYLCNKNTQYVTLSIL
jgi:hypothetical protein